MVNPLLRSEILSILQLVNLCQPTQLQDGTQSWGLAVK